MSGAAPGDQIAEMKPHFHCTRMRLEPHATPPRRTRAHVPSTCARRSVGDGASWDDRCQPESEKFVLQELRGCRDGHTNARFVRRPAEGRCRPRHPRHPRHSRHPCHSRHPWRLCPVQRRTSFTLRASCARSRSVSAARGPLPSKEPEPEPCLQLYQKKFQGERHRRWRWPVRG